MSPGTRAILARSNSKTTNSFRDKYTSHNNLSYSGDLRSQNCGLARSKSSTFLSQQKYLARPGLLKSSSTTFTRPVLKKDRASSIDHSGLRKSHSTATLPRSAKLFRDEIEGSTPRSGYESRKSLPAVLRRSSSNDFSYRTRTHITARDSIDELSEATIRSKQAREKHRQRPENILQIRKNPPVSMKNMNVRANQVVRSSSFSAKTPTGSRSVNRSKSTSAINSPYRRKSVKQSYRGNFSNSESESNDSTRKQLSYFKNSDYQSPYAQDKTKRSIRRLSESDSCSEGFSQKFSLVRKTSKKSKRHDMGIPQNSTLNKSSRGEISIGKENMGISPHDRKSARARRGREPYIFHNLSHKWVIRTWDHTNQSTIISVYYFESHESNKNQLCLIRNIQLSKQWNNPNGSHEFTVAPAFKTGLRLTARTALMTPCLTVRKLARSRRSMLWNLNLNRRTC